MADEIPRCAASEKGECPRSNTVLLKEADDFWVFGCLTCKSVRVVTKPSGKARARMELAMQKERARMEQRSQRKRYFV